MLMIILIIIFFIIPHFDEVKFRRTGKLPSFIIFVKNGGILLGGCLTVKNYWGLLTGDDGVGFVGYYSV